MTWLRHSRRYCLHCVGLPKVQRALLKKGSGAEESAPLFLVYPQSGRRRRGGYVVRDSAVKVMWRTPMSKQL